MSPTPAVSATGAQIARTRQFWESRIESDLTGTDAREITQNVAGFFGVLAEWARAERTAATANCNASPNEGEARHALNTAKDLGSRRVGAT